MLAMKIDLLLKKFEDYSQDKAQMQTLQALESRMTCEACGNVGHSVIIARKPKKKFYILIETRTGFVHKEVKGGTNHARTIKEVMGTLILSILTNLP